MKSSEIWDAISYDNYKLIGIWCYVKINVRDCFRLNIYLKSKRRGH